MTLRQSKRSLSEVLRKSQCSTNFLYFDTNFYTFIIFTTEFPPQIDSNKLSILFLFPFAQKKKSKKKRHESRDCSRDRWEVPIALVDNETKTFLNSSVDKKKSKSDRKENKSKDQDVIDRRAARRDMNVVRRSRSRDRRARSPSKERFSIRRSLSRGLKKADRSKNRSPSPKHLKSPRNDRDKLASRRDQRSRSKQKQKERSVTPRKVVKRKSPTPKRNERRVSYSPRRRSVSPRIRKREESPDKNHQGSRTNRRRTRSPSPRKRSVERIRSSTPKLRSPDRKLEKSIEKRRVRSPSPRPVRRRSPSPRQRTPMRRRSPSKDLPPARNRQRRSLSRNRNRRRSPIARKRSASRSRSPIPRKSQRHSRSPRNQRGRNHNDRRSHSRSLSYSPARRNPEKYREILDPKIRSADKAKKPAPVVKLHPTTSDRESSTENETPGRNKSIEKVEAFHPIDRNQEKEFDRLKALKSELAAKAKESLEKKIISESASTSSIVPGKPKSGRTVLSPPKKLEPEPRRAREMEIVAQTSAISTKEKQAAIKEREEKRKITIKPFKINDNSPPKKISGEAAKNDVSKTVEKPVAGRKSRSRSAHRWQLKIHCWKWFTQCLQSFRSRKGSSSSGSSGSSRSSSGSSSASSRSRSSSGSSHSSPSVHSRPRSRGHSGSIPRRAGSPSFLDRRRITRYDSMPVKLS